MREEFECQGCGQTFPEKLGFCPECGCDDEMQPRMIRLSPEVVQDALDVLQGIVDVYDLDEVFMPNDVTKIHRTIDQLKGAL